MLATTGDAVGALGLLPVVLVPIGGPSTIVPVSTVTSPLPATVIGNRSMPRGAGPAFFSPTRLYCDPWHGHSNH